MTVRDEIMKICLNERLEGLDFVKAVEKQLKEVCPYNHSLEGTSESCGITGESMRFALDANGKVSEVIERIEDQATKRELALANFHLLIEAGKIPDPRKSKSSLNQFVASIMGQRKSSVHSISSRDMPPELLDMLSKLAGHEDENEDPDCDDGECWKCSKRDGCKKKK
jgi:hypothetical protein